MSNEAAIKMGAQAYARNPILQDELIQYVENLTTPTN